MTSSYNHYAHSFPVQAPDLLLGLFLAGLLIASGSFLGMARTAARAHSALVTARLGGDVLDDYRQACAQHGRSPLLLYAYLASLLVGLGALLVALL
jgi:hypothetical protein